MKIDWEAMKQGVESIQDMEVDEKYLGSYSEGEVEVEQLFYELFLQGREKER